MHTSIASLLLVCLVCHVSANPVPNPALATFQIPSIANEYLTVEDIDFVKIPPFGNFSKITDRMYHSSIGVINGTNLIKHNIKCIFDLAYELNYTVPDSSIKHYEYKTVRDRSDADLTPFLEDIVGKMETCANEDKNFVVHCVAGASRSGSAVVAYLIKHHNMTLKDAFIHSRTHRPVARPNNGFMKQLMNFEQKHHGTTSVKMIKIKRGDIEIEVPDFFETNYPDLINSDFEKERKRRESEATTVATF